MRTLPLILFSALAAQAAGQQPLFLLPGEASLPLGEAITLEAVRDAEAVGWPAGKIEHFFARTAWTQENLGDLPAQEGQEVSASWTTDQPGVLLLGLDLEPRLERVGAAEFSDFLSRMVSDPHGGALGRVGDADVSVRRHESAKALVRVEHEGPWPDSIATSKTGQFVEIRPLMDPTALTPGSDLAVRLYSKIDGAKGGTVIATNTDTREVVSAVADDSAIAHLHIATAGRWRVEFHAAARLQNEEADYALHTATLTFDVREVTK